MSDLGGGEGDEDEGVVDMPRVCINLVVNVVGE